jgi:hypothetical protein
VVVAPLSIVESVWIFSAARRSRSAGVSTAVMSVFFGQPPVPRW